ncbi:MAG: CHASE2 domain-containing protein [Deltaproteobacteria bacterium]|nr:CHASE2 domain-containing protein [Deltaproteobacteria bacterium]
MSNVLTLIALRFRRLWKVMLVISALATAGAWAWWVTDFLGISGDELGAYDDGLGQFNNVWWFPPGQWDRAEDIVIVAIDDASFADIAAFGPWRDRYGSWPYDRIIYSDVLEYLGQAGARLVVFDATLDEPKSDISGDLKFGETVGRVKIPFHMGFNVVPGVEALPKVEPVNRLGPPPPPPEPAPAPVAAGKDAKEEEFPSEDFPTEEAPDPAAQAKARQEALEKVRARAAAAFAFPVETAGGLEPKTFLPAEQKMTPDGGVATGEDVASGVELTTQEAPRNPVPAIEPLLDVVSGFGTVSLEADDDGIMRRTWFAYTDGNNTYATLALGAVADAVGADKVTLEPGRLVLGKHVVHINQDGSAAINYGGTLTERFVSVPLVDVLRYRARKDGYERFKDKVVVIAGFALGTADIKSTPFETQVPGVVKQVAEIDNLLHDRFILDAPLWLSILFALFFALISVALVMVVQSVVVDIGAPVFFYFFFSTVTGLFITVTRWHLLSAMASMAGTLACVAASAYNRFLASEERDNLKQAFAAFMDSDLAELMAEGRQLPNLAGEERVVTALSADQRGLLVVAEALRGEPKKLMHVTNRFLSAVTPIVKEQGGCIDKLQGETLVALFGAPMSHADHALRACRSALQMRAAIAELRKDAQLGALPPILAQVGIATGIMFVGNLGSDDLIDYSAIGDGMQRCAALERLGADRGAAILVDQATREAVGDALVTRRIDRVRTRDGAVSDVHEVVGEPDDVDDRAREALAAHESALDLVLAGRFADAEKLLARALELHPDDAASRALLARSRKLSAGPLPVGWDGVTVV